MENNKLAVFVNGWSPEFDDICLTGIRTYAIEQNIDVHVFLTYASEGYNSNERMGETNIYRLPELDTYQGVIVLANTLCQYERETLTEILAHTHTPVVNLEYDIPDMHFIGSDNYSGMYELAEHLFDYHNIKDFIYIGGPADNTEAQERLRAVSDAAQKYQLPLNQDNLFYGDFSFYSSVNIINDYLAIHETLPSAIMCANDAMAIGLCEKLTEYGYNIPGDVLITGFDALESGTNYYPSLSSVGRNWEKMGYDAAKFIMEEALGQTEPIKRILNSSKSIGESCGCQLCKEKYETRLNATKANGRIHSVNVTFDMHLRIMYAHMHEMKTESHFSTKITDFLLKNKEPFETETFSMCLDPNFFASSEDASLLKEVGYPDVLHSSINIYEHKDYGIETFSPKQILPSSFSSDRPQMFLFVPMHLKGKTFGYSIFKAEHKHLKEYSMYIWSRHLFQNFEQIYQNIRIQTLTDKLTSLSVTDALTGLYNRTGCNKLTIPYYEDAISHEKNVALIMCDVDCMKEINDTYGHPQGDLALRTLSAAIKASIPEDWHACRFGGDEFLITGICEDEAAMNDVIHSIEENLVEEAKKTHVPYTLVASVGGKLIYPQPQISYEAALKLADAVMYDIKSQHKEKTGGRIR